MAGVVVGAQFAAIVEACEAKDDVVNSVHRLALIRSKPFWWLTRLMPRLSTSF